MTKPSQGFTGIVPRGAFHILDALQYGIDHFDMDELTRRRQSKRTL